MAVCGVGLLTGLGLRRLSSENPAIANRAAPVAQPGFGRESATPPDGNSRPAKSTPTRSTDNVDSILLLDPASNYARIARWLATAGEQEIAGYWEGYQKGPRTVAVTDLIFINWTRRNPQAALASVVGTGDERYAWWAWTASDPQGALAAAEAAGTEVASEQFAYGIGDFNPDWLRANLDRVPSGFRGEAFGRMKNWPAGQEPLASLKFTNENGMEFDPRIFQNLVRKDPWAAFEWLKGNPDKDPFSNHDQRVNTLASTLAREKPEELERLAAGTSQGAARRTMEQALFDHLLESDPTAALEQARAVGAPLIAAQRLGQIGLGMLSTDPEKAFEIAREILAANPEHLDIRNCIEYENGSIQGVDRGKANELMDALFAKDREKTLAAMAVPPAGKNSVSGVFSQYAAKWAEDDLDGFMAWTDRQSDAVQQVSSEQIGFKLAKSAAFSEAIEWMGRAPAVGFPYSFVLSQWQGADPAAAAAWVENSDLTNELKTHYRDFLKRAAQ